MFKKAYVEITNICNLSCDFCHGTKRTPHRLTAAEFNCIMQKLKGHTEYVYLQSVCEVCKHLAENGTICALRLWNSGGAEALNGEILDFLRQFFGSDWQKNRDGFSNREPHEALCRRCGFAGRFSL